MDLINSFAVVAYLSDPVAAFVDGLRRELTPGCPHRAHLTVLPPRPLWIDKETAIEKAREILARFEPFHLEFGAVTTFPSTHVVRLSIRSGLSEFHTLHDILNTGPFERPEEYEYVPHVTLCHDLNQDDCGKHLEIASRRWNEFLPTSPLFIDHLTVVQQASDDTWVDVEDLPLGRLQPVHVRR